MEEKKLKVVWICHFTNKEVQKLLPLWKKKNEFSSWIVNNIKGFEKLTNVELHVICPHEYLIKSTALKLRSVNYFFIPIGIPVFRRHWPRFFRYDIWSGYSSFRKKAKRIVDSIQPDIIHLLGAENAYYSSSILDLYKKYPTLVTIQGFVCDYKDDKNLGQCLRKRIEIEEEIFKKVNNFSGDEDAPNTIKKYNSDFNYFKLEYAVNEELALSIQAENKEYDCIFFGRLTEDKGILEFIKAISLIKEKLPNVKACVLGDGDIRRFEKISEEMECSGNIKFAGFAETQQELFTYVKSSRVFMAPALKDRLSSTIRESMLLKVPVVAYATGAIPSINNNRENIVLVNTGDYKAMAEKTIEILKNKERANFLAKNAFEYFKEEFSLDVNVKLFLSSYNTILKSKI